MKQVIYEQNNYLGGNIGIHLEIFQKVSLHVRYQIRMNVREAINEGNILWSIEDLVRENNESNYQFL